MRPAAYETVNTKDEPASQTGLPGKALFRFTDIVRWYLLAVGIYGIAGIGLAIYILRCPVHSPAYRVLPTGDLKVDQFYSGIALSSVLTPAAIVIRRIAYEVALLHPFAIASTMPTDVADLDTLMDPGIWAMTRLFKYSRIRATIQAFLLAAGAFLVPIGTLLIFTGTYAASLSRIANVGMPTISNNMMTLDIDMSYSFSGPRLHKNDSFLNLATNMFVGNLIRQTGVLTETNFQLGPTPTANLTYEEEVRYDGIVTYTWSSGCKYTKEISYTETTSQYMWLFNITFPDGSTETNIDAYGSVMYVSNVTSTDNVTTTYYAIIGINEQTVNLDTAQRSESAIEVKDGAWISRVACTPTFNWEVSSCLWHDGNMTDCHATPGANTTALDNAGLDALIYYLNAVPLQLLSEESDTYMSHLQTLEAALMFNPKGTDIYSYRAPLLADYNNMYGVIAQSIASVSLSGYYGAAEVPATGSAPKPVYLIRTYILAIVVAILVLTPLFTAAVFVWTLTQHIPVRSATFLTIANAVRGPKWDATLWGGCLMTPAELRRRHRGLKVMFGVDEQAPSHVGFAEQVSPVQREALYYGVKPD